ncbi:MAG: hypothetical protein Q8J68_02790 [Methanolobus sp.]|uniref:hypothetical protein n=1 Tax=Methanolobus sp. TaxID=1874737 RepID=UPI0027320AC2|nr:hypothetical protein [Methanolobus sp.]MDP2216199.1 hypothetical protein [Methanolobus sp.]
MSIESLNLVEWVGLIGSIVSIAGLPFALLQISRTRSAAEAAKKAATQAQQSFQKNIIVADLSSCARFIGEIQSQIRSERWEAALYRINELKTVLIQVRHLRDLPVDDSDAFVQAITSQLSVLLSKLEQRLVNPNVKMDPVAINKKLDQISDSLFEVSGKAKYL